MNDVDEPDFEPNDSALDRYYKTMSSPMQRARHQRRIAPRSASPPPKKMEDGSDWNDEIIPFEELGLDQPYAIDIGSRPITPISDAAAAAISRKRRAEDHGEFGFHRLPRTADDLADLYLDLEASGERLSWCQPVLGSALEGEVDSVYTQEGQPSLYVEELSEGPLDGVSLVALFERLWDGDEKA